MNDSYQIFKELYKPYRIIKKGNATIFETTEGLFVLKEKGKANISELYSYLKSRNFNNFPKLIDFSRDNINVFEYVEETYTPTDQKANDLIDLVGKLHTQTSFFKETKDDNYREIRDNIIANLNSILYYYNDLFNTHIKDSYYSPSIYLFLRNYEIINDSISFSKEEINNWYNLVKEDNKQRVCMIHNNLKLDHYIRNKDKDVLISWDNSTIESPVMDILNIYHNTYDKIVFSNILNNYLENYKLSDSEKKLLFACICIPYKYEINNNELITTKNVYKLLNYLYKSESLIRPYYTIKEEK